MGQPEAVERLARGFESGRSRLTHMGSINLNCDAREYGCGIARIGRILKQQARADREGPKDRVSNGGWGERYSYGEASQGGRSQAIVEDIEERHGRKGFSREHTTVAYCLLDSHERCVVRPIVFYYFRCESSGEIVGDPPLV
jgi:hypothetical protein